MRCAARLAAARLLCAGVDRARRDQSWRQSAADRCNGQQLERGELNALARADALASLTGNRRDALFPAFALTTDTSVLTAIGNDYGYERLFARQVEAVGGRQSTLRDASNRGSQYSGWQGRLVGSSGSLV